MLLKRRDFSLQVWSKLFERRIAAHEKVIALAVEMRVMVTLGGIDERGETRRAPQILISRDEFERWLARFAQASMEGSTWLTTATKREVNFVQDYLVTLHMYLAEIPSEKYLQVGEIIRQDFIDLSSSLEKEAYEYFKKGVRKLRLDSLDEHHKYKITETESRLVSTELLRSVSVIDGLRDRRLGDGRCREQ